MERDKETEKEREKEKRSRTIRDEATAYAEGNEFRLSSASSQLIANNPTNWSPIWPASCTVLQNIWKGSITIRITCL